MLTALRKRLEAGNEKGFTLIELLVVIIIIGILLAIAVPSYLGFRERASRSAAQANVRSAIPSVETYSADNDGSATEGPSADADPLTSGYEGMTTALLQGVDAGLSPTLTVGPTLGAAQYCISSTVGGFTYVYGLGNAGPFVNGQVTEGTCP